jgi:undecaprenyl-diphosphatase
VHGYAVDPTYAFPSGHATLAVAVCGTLAYVLWRERLLSGAAAIGAGIALPVVVGISRVYLDMHWATDVAGGWLAGLIVAAAAAAGYERTTTRTTRTR